MVKKMKTLKAKETTSQIKIKSRNGEFNFEDKLPASHRFILNELKILLNVYGTVSCSNIKYVSERLQNTVQKSVAKAMSDLMSMNGYKYLGKGVTAKAWDLGNYVVRVSSPFDNGGAYIPWVKESMKKWREGYEGLYPKFHYIYTVKFANGLEASIVIMEKLERIRPLRKLFVDIDKFVIKLQASLRMRKNNFETMKKNHVQINQKINSVYALLQSCLKNNAKEGFDFDSFKSVFLSQGRIRFNDVHLENVMWSSQRNSFVITDPSY